MAQQEIETSILIAALPSRVWQVLTDFNAFPAWNPFIRAISGPLREGARLSIQIVPPGRSAMRFRPALLVVRPDQELRWRGSLLIPGLFTGEHVIRLQSEEVNSTRVIQGERFSGLLVGLFVRRGMLDATRQGFHSMNIPSKNAPKIRRPEEPPSLWCSQVLTMCPRQPYDRPPGTPHQNRV